LSESQTPVRQVKEAELSTTHPRFTTRIKGSAAVIFDLIADMPNYHRWLSGSQSFGGTTQVTPYPVRLGTTYLDAGPAGERPGVVTAYDPPRRIAFHQTMLLKQGPLKANIDIHVRYTLDPVEAETIVVRELDLAIQLSGLMKLAEPLILYAFRKENLRTLAELKRYVEALPT
jgi:hypothetical protein